MDRSENLLHDLPPALPDEVTDVLLRGAGRFRLERIVSHGQASPPGFWYDQDEHEWILLAEGGAGLRFKDEPAVRELHPGDHLLIPAHRRHRVEWTAPDKATIWLALFWQ
ncbi:phosphoribosylaminoimidazole carboxylase [Ruficoccus amylovorans]|uniref:Phosphoribosylaminoimidazole carboxylase n=1 Tax=Ruficoccus amylovorans TaxID=1804625 RepID=A0A842HI62_9BACT|nr:phosphoribosylaminoimidazole carboxylase [Ruficoccus amylovorans]